MSDTEYNIKEDKDQAENTTDKKALAPGDYEWVWDGKTWIWKRR